MKEGEVPVTQFHLVPLPDRTQAAIDHLERLGYTIVAPTEEKKKEKLRAA